MNTAPTVLFAKGCAVDPLSTDIPSSILLSASGEGHVPGHIADFDYYHGVGVGGHVGLDGIGGQGGGGAAVIIARVPGVLLPARTSFFFTGERQKHVCSC